ncbi:MAG: hypothetical protein SNJ82_02330 [Gemmataceae bacterium]
MSRDQEWMGRFEATAIRRGDDRRLCLARAIYQADSLRQTRPDEALQVVEQACQLAVQLQEPWWELFYRDRRAGLLMKYLGQVRAGLEQAVRNALRLHEPAFAQFPWRFRVLDLLVVGYLHTDPVGYAQQIREALDALQAEQPETGPGRYLVLARRRWLAAECGQLEQAIAYAQQGLALAAGDADRLIAASHAVFCYSNWCHSLWRLGLSGREAELLALAQEGERLAGETGHRLECSEFQLWQALLARQDGHEATAQLLMRQAVDRVRRLGMLPDHLYFDALCAFHLAGHEVETALAIRTQELTTLAGQGRLSAESRCRLQRCRLLHRLGQLSTGELQATRAVLEQLRHPEAALAEWLALQADQSPSQEANR